MDIGHRIKQERIKRGLSIRNLALKTNLAPSTISRIEKGISTPDIKTTYIIANFFGTTTEYLLNGTKIEETPKTKTFNVYSSSPLYNTKEYLTIIEMIDHLTRDELIMLKGMILALLGNESKERERKV